MLQRGTWIVVGLLAGWISTGCGPEPERPILSHTAAIVGGALDPGHAAVGMVVTKGTGQLCTGTLVGQKTVLTASFCVSKTELPSFITGTLAAPTTHTVAKATVHPQASTTGPDNQVALLQLTSAPGLTATALTDAAPSAGMGVTMVGYGTTGVSATDAGEKRSAKSSITATAATTFTVGASSGPSFCNGDAGGPIYVVINGKLAQIGLAHSTGYNCGTPSTSLRIDKVLSWIKTTSGNDVTVVSGAPSDGGPLPQEAGPSADSATTDQSTAGDQAATDTSGGADSAPSADLGIAPPDGDDGCSCAAGPSRPPGCALLLVGLALVWSRRRRG